MTSEAQALNDDPLWFKDAIIYELHVRAFFDSNGDGIGDFGGLAAKLDYLVDLGVTAIWLLPFYPSPLRDGGYDIADYTSVNPAYGTLADFKHVLDEAHRRGIRIITELVLNHTSNEHPWFQRARRAEPGSSYRDFYVWSDTPTRYADSRIIFKDFETSNWAWDPVANAYYWHRFYSHQPDLNFDNPDVRAAMLEVVDFWMELGIDGVRLDAVPYLYERDGTSCENLAETHSYLKTLRAHIDSKYSGRMLLAEANQWPTDAAQYFGEGDECHMNFHFPLMPRMFMGVELEDAFPIKSILRQTPGIPDSCQWATFLRNHDELTLEMVTEEDRDAMWHAYAHDQTARLNLGIRRRLAPLLRVRAKIELLNVLLLSLPGTPVLYYGDELGMGDNIYLGDRDGVRTPMQWSADRNAGFSRANPQRLFLPPIIDPAFHYESINVETEEANPASLLWWMKHILAQRKLHPVFGRGSMDFIECDNHRVLCFVRESEGQSVLVVANLSRYAQAVKLDLQRFASARLVEVFGRTRFPIVEAKPYFISLGPHGFYWFLIERDSVSPHMERTLPSFEVQDHWSNLLGSKAHASLSAALLAHVTAQHWFRGEREAVTSGAIADLIPITSPTRADETQAAIVVFDVAYREGETESYVVPLALLVGKETRAAAVPNAIARVIVHAVASDGQTRVEGHLVDAMTLPDSAYAMFELIREKRTITGLFGRVGSQQFVSDIAVPDVGNQSASLYPRSGGGSSILLSDRVTLSLSHLLEEGANVGVEIGNFLAASPTFHAVPRPDGALVYQRPGREPATFAVLEESCPYQLDGWHLTLTAAESFFEKGLAHPQRDAHPPQGALQASDDETAIEARAWLGPHLERMVLLGKGIAHLHRALARPSDDPAFRIEPFSVMHQQSLHQSALALLVRTVADLRSKMASFEPIERDLARALVSKEGVIAKIVARVADHRIHTDRIRCHGDLTLRNVLWTGEQFAFRRPDGDPSRPLNQRRYKRCALVDVIATMRSIRHASLSGLLNGRIRPDDFAKLTEWAEAWSRWSCDALTRGYEGEVFDSSLVPSDASDRALLATHYTIMACLVEIRSALADPKKNLELPLRDLDAFAMQWR